MALLLVALMGGNAAQALAVQECTRTTHVSHGGEAEHQDLGEGRVMWRDWWSQEGSATDFTVMDCGPGAALMFRAAEENMNARLSFDRIDDALQVIGVYETGSRLFATFDRMAGELEKFARDVTLVQVPQEVCACAAFYPALRGGKEEFKLNGL